MLYRPNFCCHCGEKIARSAWTPLTSRRFCDFCAVEQKQHDLIPRALAVVVLLTGAAGLTAYFRTGPKPNSPQASAALRDAGRRLTTDAPPGYPSNASISNSAILTNTVGAVASDSNAGFREKGQRTPRGNSSTESLYYCGAMTKKGTPCTRRVRTAGPCWQHQRQDGRSLVQQ